MKFKPDLIEEFKLDFTSGLSKTEGFAPLPDKGSIGLQLLSVRIMDGLQGGVLGLGAATGVYLITTVVDGTSEKPIEFKSNAYSGISNGDTLPIGPEQNAIYSVYLHEGEMPRTLSFNLVVFRSNEQIRDQATLLADVISDDRYKSLSDLIKAGLSGNPLSAVLEIAEQIVSLIAEKLKVKPDDQLGYYQANYTNVFDNLGVGRHPSSEDMLVNKIRFAYEIDSH